MRYRKAAAGLVTFLILSILTTSMVLVTLRRDVAGPTRTYSALFTDVSGLHPGDDVRMAGVRVGRVDAVDLQGNLAKVEFRVECSQTLYQDTIASVTYQNIIGQRYLGLSPGASPERRILTDHGQIPVDRTEPSFDISYLLNGFEPLLTLLDPQQVDNLTNGIIKALQGDSGSILALITETSALAEKFSGSDDVLGKVIANLDEAIAQLAQQNASIHTVVGRTRDIMVGLSNRRSDLIPAMGSITTTLSRLATVTDNTYDDLSSLIDRQPGFTGQLSGEGRRRFAYFGSNLPFVLKGLARVTQEGSYANAYACNINTTIFAFLGRLIPSVVEHATPGGTIQQTPICR